MPGVIGGIEETGERVQAATPVQSVSPVQAATPVQTGGSSETASSSGSSWFGNLKSFRLLHPLRREKSLSSLSVQESGQQITQPRAVSSPQYQQVTGALPKEQASVSAVQKPMDNSSSSITRFGRSRSIEFSSGRSNQINGQAGPSSSMISTGESYDVTYGSNYGTANYGTASPSVLSSGTVNAAANRPLSKDASRGESLGQGTGAVSELALAADGRSSLPGGSSGGVKIGSGVKSTSGAAGRTEKVPSFLQGLEAEKTPEHVEHKPHGTELLGVEPGVTTIKEVEASPIWSKPGHREVVDSFLILTYRIEDLPDMPFIQILLKDNVVEGIVMHLKAPRELSDTKLSFEETIKNITPIRIPDREGGFREIYPEKGLAFVLEKGEDPSKPSSRVTQIIAEPVRASYLLIRAEKLLKSSPQQAYRDAGHAVLHEPGNAAGNWIMASLEYEWGDYQKARQHAIAAVKSDSSVPQYCLTLVKILKELHETEGAFKLLRQTVAACDSDPLLKVEAEFLLGDLYRDSVKPDYEQAIACHRRVLGIAEKYFKVENSEVRIMMKNIARKANIALAVDSARQEGEGKQGAFQYLNAASIIADDLIKKEGSDMTAIWEICLAATEVGLDVPDLKELNAYIQTMKRLSSDFIHGREKMALSVPTVQWRTGKAFHNAMLIYELQKDFKQAVQYGVRAQEYLDESGLKNFTTEDRILVGDIAWHLGHMFQEELDQKKEAQKWYEKSIAAYSECQDRVGGKNSAKIGMNLLRVSNGLWRLEKNEMGPSAAEIAVKFLDRAIKDGVLESSELLVPYTNLAMMYKKLNKMDQAKKFALEVKKLKE